LLIAYVLQLESLIIAMLELLSSESSDAVVLLLVIGALLFAGDFIDQVYLF
jgi:uncharacterized membrane protein YgdD (TMEM256/DUF423 family)